MMRLTKKQRDGLKAEKWLLGEFQARGYNARLISDWSDNLDIVIDNILGVEVKFRRAYLRHVRPGYYRPAWCFSDISAKGHDILYVLICEDDGGEWWPFFVPSVYAFGRQGFMITSHPQVYRGMLSNCLDNWANVDKVLHYRYKYASPQLSLWPEFAIAA